MEEGLLRLLAHWHARRRETEELLEPLLAHGPAAVDRVAGRLPELTHALDAERAAFDAFSRAASARDDGVTVPRPEVDELAAARRRAGQLRASSAAGVHPSVIEVLRPGHGRSSADPARPPRPRAPEPPA